jgi:histidine triad (HIT) family protein
MDDCIFCKIIAGNMSAEIIYEDENAIAFLDIKPTNPGHVLVVPRRHYRNVFDATEDVLRHMTTTVKRLSTPIFKAVEAHGLNLIMNNEPAAGQLVFHAHIHMVPRFETDGFRHWKGKAYKKGEMAEVARKIKAELN